MTRILFPVSEAYPLMKTGGLGDVAGALPPALKALGADVRILMPAYRDSLKRAGKTRKRISFHVPEHDATVTLRETKLPGTEVRVWLLDFPPAFDRSGNPYHDEHGRPWRDNAYRFALLSRVAATVALGGAGMKWRADLVHCHDWQTALVPALLAQEPARPATVFTIHNLAYQGVFPRFTFDSLRLPESLWSPEALEYHGDMSFIKGGIAFADLVTTVSPRYATEIQTPAFGHGLDGLLRHRADRLIGILNGIDETSWDPKTDPLIRHHYDSHSFARKKGNKASLQKEMGLPQEPEIPLIGMISRLAEQKGIDLVLDALPQLRDQSWQLVILGSGEPDYEASLRRLARTSGDRVAVRIGYDESLAHQIEAGADLFLMPSRFEPCGLNQMYSLRFGTVPVVHRVGGLADTVVDTEDATITAGTATGFVFDGATPTALVSAVSRAILYYEQKKVWRKIALTGMKQSFSWRTSAEQYMHHYRTLSKGQR
ncbi:MAG: glycogen synthase GlgA [Acidiferrobacteraceae bacterium]|jgi:starch synthase